MPSRPLDDPTIVAVLMGGPSQEHDISRESGRLVCRGLLECGFRVRPVVIGRDRRFAVGPELDPGDGGELAEASWRSPVERDLDALEAAPYLRSAGITLVFLALHGPGGEDGSIQGWLEWNRLPFVGAGVRASAIAMDKSIFKAAIAARGHVTPRYLAILADDWRRDRAAVVRRGLAGPGLPAVLKAASLGSSYGIALVDDADELEAAIDTLMPLDFTLLWEERVAGVELTCAVLGAYDGELTVFPPVEIVPKRDRFFDLRSKYEPGGADEIVPARIPDAMATELGRVASDIHRLIQCRGISRTDAILADGRFYILETNTIPGMTPASLYPKAAAAGGVAFPDLLRRMVALVAPS